MKQSKGELAKEYSQSGANCAQAVLAAYHEECGLDEKTAFRLASGFGAGMGRMREVCGAVSGMILAANILRGADDITDKAMKDAHYALFRF
jgi:C_GCAxxG_C_C family probable redox protein